MTAKNRSIKKQRMELVAGFESYSSNIYLNKIIYAKHCYSPLIGLDESFMHFRSRYES